MDKINKVMNKEEHKNPEKSIITSEYNPLLVQAEQTAVVGEQPHFTTIFGHHNKHLVSSSSES